MLLPDAIALAKRMIEKNEYHQDYQRTVDIANDCRIFSTGKDIEKKLIRIIKREAVEAFAQRLRLTIAVTPATWSIIKKPFNKVVRNDRVRKDTNIKDKTKQAAVIDMAQRFYGSPTMKNRGLDYWMKTRFKDCQFLDPNTWVVAEWDNVDQTKPVYPRPFEVSAEMAVNFKVENGDVKWLFVKQDITVNKMNASGKAFTKTGLGDLPATYPFPYADLLKRFNPQPGFRYTLYDADFTVVLEETTEDFLKAQGIEYNPEDIYTFKSKTYLIKSFTPKLGFPPAFRIGYKTDDVTNGRTFVSPLHDALCYFEKTIHKCSEFDLTTTLHTFPKLIQYIQECSGAKNRDGTIEGCKNGYTLDGKTCQACNGTGMIVHKSTQDAMFVPMPRNAKPADLLDLDKLMVYKSPPIELVKFQNDLLLQLEQQAYNTMYGSGTPLQRITNNGTGTSTETATATDYNVQEKYDTLEPFTEKYSETWIWWMTCFARLAGDTTAEITHAFPADFKLKNDIQLLTERKMAVDSGAPGFIVKSIDDDYAEIINAGNKIEMAKYWTKARYDPFVDNTPDEVAMLLTSSDVPRESKVLWSNFEPIFRELALENPEFYLMTDVKAQKALVDAKVQEWILKLDKQKPVVNIDILHNTNPLSAGTNAAAVV